MAQSSRSSSTVEHRNANGFVCECNLPAKISKAWTDKNPGQRFYTCRGRKVGTGYENCKFFEWVDLENPGGWQKEALIEARNVMNRQREELKSLKEIINSLERQGGSMEVTKPAELKDEMNAIQEECAKLKGEILILTERSTVYRNVLITSSVGFTVIIGVLMGIWKQ